MNTAQIRDMLDQLIQADGNPENVDVPNLAARLILDDATAAYWSPEGEGLDREQLWQYLAAVIGC